MTNIAFSPFFASGALRFAFEKATTEGKMTICALIILSIFSWTVIITKSRQLYRARKAGRKFFHAYRETRDPLEIARRGEEFDGAPAYELYYTGAEEVEDHLKNNTVRIEQIKRQDSGNSPSTSNAETDILARQITTKISAGSFDQVRV